MSKMQMRLTFILLATVVLLAVQAYAHDITVSGGWANPGSLTLRNVRSGFNGAQIYNLTLGINFLKVLGLDNTVGWSPNFFRPEAPELGSIGRIRGFTYNTNLIVSVPIQRFVPYASAGLGLIRLYRGDDDLREIFRFDDQALFNTKFAVNYGGGVKFPRLIGPLGVRFDARGFTGMGFLGRNWNIFQVSGGVLLTFGE